ncbi:hypothetical protein BDR22DRAFT_973689 [Usnea florida]
METLQSTFFAFLSLGFLTFPTAPPPVINISNATIKLSFTTDTDNILADPLPQSLTSGFNGMPIYPSFVRQNPNIISFDSDDGSSSDTTLIADRIVERTRPVSKARRKRHGRRIDAHILFLQSASKIKRLIDAESDEGCSIPQSGRRSRFRGRKIQGGMSPGWLEDEIAFERVQQAKSLHLGPFRPRTNPAINQATSRKCKRRYILGDAFCGGGGVSSGAEMVWFLGGSDI